MSYTLHRVSPSDLKCWYSTPTCTLFIPTATWFWHRQAVKSPYGRPETASTSQQLALLLSFKVRVAMRRNKRILREHEVFLCSGIFVLHNHFETSSQSHFKSSAFNFTPWAQNPAHPFLPPQCPIVSSLVHRMMHFHQVAMHKPAISWLISEGVNWNPLVLSDAWTAGIRKKNLIMLIYKGIKITLSRKVELYDQIWKYYYCAKLILKGHEFSTMHKGPKYVRYNL